MSIYQHFRPEEKEFIDQVLNWKEYVLQSYSMKLTDFLDPREQMIAKSVIGQQDEMIIKFFGGQPNTERKRMILCPDYLSLSEEDFEIALFEIKYPTKFTTITHPKVLGSLMSLGIKRGKFGDILIHEDVVQFYVAKEIASYVQMNLQSVGKVKISLIEKPFAEAIKILNDWEEFNFTTPSLRLDAILSHSSKLSRQKAQILIQQGLVKVNFRIIEQPSFELQEGDLISARGIGRIKLLEIGEKTKKDKWKIKVGKQK
mgnify:CR=1 FL=1